MKTYLANIIPKIQKFSKRLDDLTKLVNQHWVSLDEKEGGKRVFIFRGNNDLIISENGVAEKGRWEYLGNQSLLLETRQESYLLKHGFFDENILALKLDNTDNYAFFVNETKYHGELNTIEDILRLLEHNYLNEYQNAGNAGFKGRTGITEQYNFRVISEREAFDFILGAHTLFEIEFTNGVKDKVYRGYSTGKFFYLDGLVGKVYCSSFENAVYNLFLSCKR